MTQPNIAPRRTPAKGISAARRADGLANLIGLVSFACVCLGYQLISLQHPRTDLSSYGSLARSFLHGRLDVRPAPWALLRLADPYDPRQNGRLGVADLTLYDGKLYWYLGPAPAILLMPLHFFLGESSTLASDSTLVMAFLALLAGSAALLIVRARRLFFPGAPPWTVAVAMASVCLCLPLGALATLPHVLEVANAGGQAFLLLGIYFAFRAFAGEGADWRWLLAASLAWALSWGCRLSLAAAVGIVAGLAFLEAARRVGWRQRPLRVVFLAAVLGLPLLAAAGGLAWYNFARFHDWRETGWNYQLAWMNHHALRGKGILVSPRNIPVNLYRYLLELPVTRPTAPYLALQRGAHGPVPWFHPPFAYALEYVGGLLWSVPSLWLATGLAMRRRSPLAQEQWPAYRWLVATLLSAALAGLAPVMLAVGSVERYLSDGAPTLLLLAALGSWRLLDRAPGEQQRRSTAFGILFFTGLTLLFTACLVGSL